MTNVLGRLLTLCAVAVLGWGTWVLFQPRSYHATECGVGPDGPYAKVTVVNWTAGLGRKQVPVQVVFRYAGKELGSGSHTFTLPALGSVSAVVTPGTNKQWTHVDPRQLTCTIPNPSID